MFNVTAPNTNIQFRGRNKEIQQAQRILHKIKSEYPAASPYIANLFAQKRLFQLEQDSDTIDIAKIIEYYCSTDNIGATLTNNNLTALRKVQQRYIDDDYRYCDSLMWGIKNLRAMNCKENSELAFLIFKAVLRHFRLDLLLDSRETCLRVLRTLRTPLARAEPRAARFPLAKRDI